MPYMVSFVFPPLIQFWSYLCKYEIYNDIDLLTLMLKTWIYENIYMLMDVSFLVCTAVSIHIGINIVDCDTK